MEEFITDERTGLRYELVGGLLSDRRRGRAGGHTSAFGNSDTCGIFAVLLWRLFQTI